MTPSQRRTGTARESLPVSVVCPSCGQIYKVASRLVGRRLACQVCRHQWRANTEDSSLNRFDALAQSGQRVLTADSSSAQKVLQDELPPIAGTISTVVDTNWVGRKLGRYRVVSLLGYGGMGVVWRAHDDTLRRDVALKILTTGKDRKKAGLTVELFKQEARAVAKLRHPSVVAIYEIAEDDGQEFLALELMDGGTLKEVVDREGAVAPRDLFAQLAGPVRALDLAHRRGVIHRDIKPGNLMFDDLGHLKLMDFGLADVAGEEASDRLKGKAVGSLGWVAPETARGEATTALSDIYSMGLVIVFALAGRPWLQGKTRSQLLDLHQNPPELDLTNIPGLTPFATAILRKCLAIRPEDRYESAGLLADALDAASKEEPPPVVAAAPPPRSRTRRASAWMLAGVALIAAAAGYVAYRHANDRAGQKIKTRQKSEASRSPSKSPALIPPKLVPMRDGTTRPQTRD